MLNTEEANNLNKLILQTIRTIIIGSIAFGAMLFLPAWTLDYWQAWIFIVVFMLAANGIGVYLSIKDPALLERRKRVGPGAEQKMAQKIIMSFSIIGSLGVIIFSAFDYRFGWSPVAAYVSLAGDALIALGFLIILLVFKENSYGSSTIEIAADQKVISSGPYAVVKHPMYAGVLVMMIGVPLALGSLLGLLVLVLMTPILIWRILDEEKFLKRDLAGYMEYSKKVRYRLVPYLW